MNGQNKVENQGLDCSLRCLASEQPRKWSGLVHQAEYNYNTTCHLAIIMMPFKVVYGRESPPLSKYVSPASLLHKIDIPLVEQDNMIDLTKENLAKVRTTMKNQAGKHGGKLEFMKGD